MANYVNIVSLFYSMIKLLKPTPDRKYMDLVVSYANSDPNEEDEMGPAVRYFFKWWIILLLDTSSIALEYHYIRVVLLDNSSSD